ncbi:hypothetical protein [Stenotrophomonas sp.]|uniref:hypothetical protein n=1 Tax=Stenotrophomonas sp. TaxID=69392 RepID=UPI0028AFE0C6|nr:hypothetical protein [Stenotrophomonas sp.]
MSYPKPNTFCLCVSMTDLVLYFGEGDDDYVAHPSLDAVIATLGLQIDVRRLYDDYFSGVPTFVGHTHVFHGVSTRSNIFALDLFRDNDQLDLIQLVVVCSEHRSEAVRFHIRAFFDAAHYAIAYEESPGSTRSSNVLDARQYPKLNAGSNYLQQIHFVPAARQGDLEAAPTAASSNHDAR